MAEENGVLVVEQLPGTATPGDRFKVGKDGNVVVWTGGKWMPAAEWDAMSQDSQIAVAQRDTREAEKKSAGTTSTGTTASDADALYDPYNEDFVKGKLLEMGVAERDKILKDLYESGGYGGSKRGNGFAPADINAFSQLLSYSNLKKTDFKTGIKLYQKDFAKQPDLIGSTARRQPKTITNPDEIKAVFRQTAQNLLGRYVDDALADQFVRTIQSQQATYQQQLATQSGGTVVEPPNAQVAAQQQIEERFQEELRVQNAATFASSMDDMIKGLAQ